MSIDRRSTFTHSFSGTDEQLLHVTRCTASRIPNALPQRHCLAIKCLLKRLPAFTENWSAQCRMLAYESKVFRRVPETTPFPALFALAILWNATPMVALDAYFCISWAGSSFRRLVRASSNPAWRHCFRFEPVASVCSLAILATRNLRDLTTHLGICASCALVSKKQRLLMRGTRLQCSNDASQLVNEQTF